MYFSDANETQTSGEGKLVTETPKNWDLLYPGMNIHFEAQAVIQGAKWEKPKYEGTTTVYTTGAVLRAQIRLEVIDTNGRNDSALAQDIYNWIWPQLYDKATTDQRNTGYWIMDELDKTKAENNYFYYVNKGQNKSDSGDYIMTEVGGVDYNVAVGFLNDAVITMPAIELTNYHADCDIKFTIVFNAIQAFFPYTPEDINSKYEGELTGGRSDKVTVDDLGMAKPLSVKNARRMFKEAQDYRDDKLTNN
jgi:hypothetical protein